MREEGQQLLLSGMTVPYDVQAVFDCQMFKRDFAVTVQKIVSHYCRRASIIQKRSYLILVPRFVP